MSSVCNHGAEQNSESGTVPNGSKVGRPARLSDEDLIDLVTSLVTVDGLPTLDAIISAAGGCKRSRAVMARKAVANQLASGELSSQVRLPEEIELQHRRLMHRWLEYAHQQIEPAMKIIVAQAETRAADAEMTAQDARTQLEQVTAERDAAQTHARQLTKMLESITSKASRHAAEIAKWKSLAQERERLLQALTQATTYKPW